METAINSQQYYYDARIPEKYTERSPPQSQKIIIIIIIHQMSPIYENFFIEPYG